MPEVKQKPDFFNTKTAISCTSLSQMLEVTRLAGFWGWHWYSTKAGKMEIQSIRERWKKRLVKPLGISLRSAPMDHGEGSMILDWADVSWWVDKGFKIIPYSDAMCLLGSGSSIQQSAPRNNDGRETCWWCRSPTRKAGGGFYDVCTAVGCGK